MKTKNGLNGIDAWQFTASAPSTSFDGTLRREAGAIPPSGELAARMGRIIAATEGLSLCAPVRLNVCCFSAAPDDWDGPAQDALNAKTRHRLQATSELVFTPLTLNGRTVIRAAVTNLASQADIEGIVADAVHSRNEEVQRRSADVGYHRNRWLRLHAQL